MTANLRPLERVSNLSEQDFANVILSNRPVIIEDATRGWYANGGWTPDYLAQKLGHLRIKIRTSTSHMHPDRLELPRAPGSRPLLFRALRRIGPRRAGQDRTDEERASVGEEEWFSVRDYLKLLATHAQAFRYMASPEELNFFEDGKWNESFATLRPDFAVPAYVPQSRPLHCGMWISPKGCRSRLHYDGGRVHNLNAQVMGTKHVTLYSPTMSAKLYNYQSTSGYLGHYSQVNVEDVDHQRFPLFSEVDGYDGILKSGDLLLIPTYWYHTFKHIGDFNVNVNFWWHAEFIRLTAASARDHCIGALLKTTSGSKIQQWRLRSWARRMERAILQSQ